MKKLILFLASALLLIATAMALAISITPIAANTNDNLYCSTDSNPGSYTYKWYNNGNQIRTGQTLESSYTSHFQTYTCKVYLQWTDEMYLGEASRTITNSLPTDPALVISSGPYYNTTVVTATASGSTDADNDNIIYQYRFVRNSIAIDNDNVFDCNGNCAIGDVITAEARAYDGYGYSNWVPSTSFTIVVDPATVNNPPTAPTSISLSNGPSYYANSVITATALGSTDADGTIPTYEYRFGINGIAYTFPSSNSQFNCTFYDIAKGDIIAPEARAYDGTDYSSWFSGTAITISNSAPSNLVVEYPQNAYAGGTFNVTANADDADNDALNYAYVFIITNVPDTYEPLDPADIAAVDYFLNEPDTFSYTINSTFANKFLYAGVAVTDGSFYMDGNGDLQSTSDWIDSGFENWTILQNQTNQTAFEYCPVNSSASDIALVKIKDEGDIEGEKFKPLEKIEIKAVVKNNAHDDRDAVVEAVLVLNGVKVSDTEVDKTVNINDGDSETIVLEMTIPADLSEGSYQLFVKAYDDDDKTDCQQKIFNIEITKKTHEVAFDSLDIPSTASVGSVIVIEGKIVNIGKEDEDKVRITYTDDMGNTFYEEKTDLESGDSTDFSFNVKVPASAFIGEHSITLEVEYDYDNKKYGESTDETYTLNVVAAKQKEEFSFSSQELVTETPKSGFELWLDKNWLAALVGALETAAVIYVISILLRKV